MNKLLPRSVSATLLVSALFLMACATQKESVYVPPPEIRVVEPPAPEIAVEQISCEEVTSRSTNRSGIEAMPFMRLSFADATGSGQQDMIIGNKNGHIFLYGNSGDPALHPWRQIYGYFGKVKAGAASSPVLADIDGDGKAELILGTGGFSSESGKILIYKNEGSAESPHWRTIGDSGMSVGKDAAITVVDYNFDGRPDIIACNSEGKLFFFRNESSGGVSRFVRDTAPPIKAQFGMYAVPAAKKIGNRVFLVIGNSMGKLFIFEIRKEGRGLTARQNIINIRAKTFASPAFASLFEKDRVDLVVADGDGMITYYENQKGDFSALRKKETVYSNRLFAGPVCTPTVTCVGNRTYMVVGNMDGMLRLFERDEAAQGMLWTEKKGYLSGIRVEGFSRGLLAIWEGKEILITGQGSGRIRAFLNTGGKAPLWKEQNNFFRGVRVKEHSTPVILDGGGNHNWTLISGSGDGRIYGYRIREVKHGLPVWERVEGVFDNVRADQFSAPSIVKDEKAVYLFVGQQDGRIRTYKADITGKMDVSRLRFRETGFLPDIRMDQHSSPFVQLNNGIFDVMTGDYSGNLRHFICKNRLL
jgi:hypothetical protein